MRGPGAAGSSIPSQLPHPRPGDVGGRGGSKVPGKAGGHSQGQRHAVSRARPRLGLKPGGHSQARASGRGCAAEDARSSLARCRRVCSGRLPRRWDKDTRHGSSQTLATSQRQTQTAPASKATPGTSLPPPPPRPGCLALPALFSLPPQSWSVSWRVLSSGPPPPGRTCRHPPPLRPCTAARPACHQLSVRKGHMHGVARPRSRPLPLSGHFPPMTCLLACCLSLATDVLPGRERGRPCLWQTFHRAFPEAKSTDGNHPSGTDDSASCRRGVTSALERQLRADHGTEGPTPWPTETQRAREAARGRQGPGGPQSMAPGRGHGRTRQCVCEGRDRLAAAHDAAPAGRGGEALGTASTWTADTGPQGTSHGPGLHGLCPWRDRRAPDPYPPRSALEWEAPPRPVLGAGVGVGEGGGEACALSSPGRGHAVFRKQPAGPSLTPADVTFPECLNP